MIFHYVTDSKMHVVEVRYADLEGLKALNTPVTAKANYVIINADEFISSGMNENQMVARLQVIKRALLKKGRVYIEAVNV